MLLRMYRISRTDRIHPFARDPFRSHRLPQYSLLNRESLCPTTVCQHFATAARTRQADRGRLSRCALRPNCPTAQKRRGAPWAPLPRPVGYLDGIDTLTVKISWSFAGSPLAAVPPHTAGATVGVPVPGHRNRSGLRVSDHSGSALSTAVRPL